MAKRRSNADAQGRSDARPSKAVAAGLGDSSVARKGPGEDEGMGEFEDNWEDEADSDEEIVDAGDDDIEHGQSHFFWL